MEVDVEVLAVNDDEARALLLSIDPLAALAQMQEQIHRLLPEITPTDFEQLKAARRRSPPRGLLRPHAPRAEMRNTRWNFWTGWVARGWSAKPCYRRPVYSAVGLCSKRGDPAFLTST